MHVTMVKKRLLSGEPCRKCAQAEELLKARGLWDRIDEVVWADEGDPASPGMKLGARLGVKLAPFFVVTGGPRAPRRSTRACCSSSRRSTRRARGQGRSRRARAARGRTSAAVEGAARDLADAHPSAILRWGLERWGASLGIAFSGAEDVVLVHMASELGLPFSVFCLDTGRLHPETYRFIDSVRKRYKIEIALMSPEAAPLQALVRKKGLFSFYEDGHEECCGIRKVEPLRRKLATLRAWATGQRRDQSPATRAAIAVVERDPTFAGVGGAGPRQTQSPRPVDIRRNVGLHPARGHSAQSAPRARLHLDWLRALHASHAAGRARTRGPLVVGREHETGVRPPHRQYGASRP